jgi:hypothetical protein
MTASNELVIDHLDVVVDSLRYRPVATTVYFRIS